MQGGTKEHGSTKKPLMHYAVITERGTRLLRSQQREATRFLTDKKKKASLSKPSN